VSFGDHYFTIYGLRAFIVACRVHDYQKALIFSRLRVDEEVAGDHVGAGLAGLRCVEEVAPCGDVVGDWDVGWCVNDEIEGVFSESGDDVAVLVVASDFEVVVEIGGACSEVGDD